MEKQNTVTTPKFQIPREGVSRKRKISNLDSEPNETLEESTESENAPADLGSYKYFITFNKFILFQVCSKSKSNFKALIEVNKHRSCKAIFEKLSKKNLILKKCLFFIIAVDEADDYDDDYVEEPAEMGMKDLLGGDNEEDDFDNYDEEMY